MFIPYGLVPYGFLVDSMWIPSGIQVDSRWNPGGFQVDSTWNTLNISAQVQFTILNLYKVFYHSITILATYSSSSNSGSSSPTSLFACLFRIFFV